MSLFSRLLNQLCNKGRPPRLMARANAGSVVSMEVFIEGNRVAPERILLEFRCAAEDGTPPGLVAEENVCQAPRQLRSDFVQGDGLTGSGRVLNLVLITEEVMELL